MYLQTILTQRKTPDALKKHFHEHFFKPYENTSAFIHGFFYPLEALFEETLPNLVLSLHFIGQAVVSAATTFGYLLLAKNVAEEGFNALNALALSALTLLTAVFAPIFETLRFFTRWASTLHASLSHQEEPTQNLPAPRTI